MRAPRTYESDIKLPTLRYLAKQPSGFATTSDLISHLEEEFRPSGADAEVLNGRSDTRFSQIVRNMISNRNRGMDIAHVGYVRYIKPMRGLSITEPGRQFLSALPD